MPGRRGLAGALMGLWAFVLAQSLQLIKASLELKSVKYLCCTIFTQGILLTKRSRVPVRTYRKVRRGARSYLCNFATVIKAPATGLVAVLLGSKSARAGPALPPAGSPQRGGVLAAPSHATALAPEPGGTGSAGSGMYLGLRLSLPQQQFGWAGRRISTPAQPVTQPCRSPSPCASRVRARRVPRRIQTSSASAAGGAWAQGLNLGSSVTSRDALA